MKQRLLVLAGTILGAAAGAAAGYFLAQKMLKDDYDRRLEAEIMVTKTFYGILYKRGEDSTPEGALNKRTAVPSEEVESYTSMTETLGYNPLPRRQPMIPDVPHIIELDVYMNGEVGYDQKTFTYYTEDEQLADEADEIVLVTELIGELALSEIFGHLSGDKDTVFVRNDRLQLDLELVRVEGSYAEIVAGLST